MPLKLNASQKYHLIFYIFLDFNILAKEFRSFSSLKSLIYLN